MVGPKIRNTSFSCGNIIDSGDVIVIRTIQFCAIGNVNVKGCLISVITSSFTLSSVSQKGCYFEVWIMQMQSI